ncbi:MAG TPA: recombination mediator RecR [Vicinamibacterales bacterium]|nr:recombination mediator RecR [Vicinamibacterales bacterium]
MSQPEPLTRLIDEFQRLPGVGRKSAQRLAFHILRTPREDADRLCQAVQDVKERVTYCSVCNNITDVDPCGYCSEGGRDHRVICVVEEPQNVIGIEKTRDFKGAYHVLMGAISPLQGIGPDELKIKGLLARVERGGVEEVILATNPNVEGEATAIYLARLLKPLGVRVTRIAMGVPVGSDLEYADEITVHKAMEGRREM